MTGSFRNDVFIRFNVNRTGETIYSIKEVGLLKMFIPYGKRLNNFNQSINMDALRAKTIQRS